jgi:diguanylate cyclase (GGDEF)-like protein
LSTVDPHNRSAGHGSQQALYSKAQGVLESGKLEITKRWLGRLIAELDDIKTLESFPTQDSIRVSVDLIDGLASSLTNDEVLGQFAPGGRLYKRAAILGDISGTDGHALVSLSQSLLALENTIWDLLSEALRHEDRELLALVVRLRQSLHGIFTASAEAYYLKSSTELDRLAHTDVLTSLYNRRYLLQELERHVEIFKRYHHPFSILMLDLDNLKRVNDTLGHHAGDAALKHLAMLLRVNVRDVDIPCRYGGDEFIVLMPETEKPVVDIVGRRIAESLEKTKLKVGSALVNLQVSSGSASCPFDGRESEELLQEADASLYRAKERRPGEGSASDAMKA